MIQQLKQADRWHGALFLAAMSAFSLVLSLIRYHITGSYMYIFLNWNLFLAFIPWFISTLVMVYGYQHKKRGLILLLLSWLAFFPNSPYILTDLFHLKAHRSSAPIWFDWTLILSFAWTGLMFGFASLRDIESILAGWVKRKYIVPLIILLLFIAAFGVYVGRFLRWNSWDIVSSPLDLGEDVVMRIIHPFRYVRTWIITLLMGLLLNMMYFSPRILKSAH